MTPADYDRLLTVIRALLDRQTRVIAAIDGRCGAGKSTLAAQLQEPVTVPAARLTIVEGAYACHPALWDSYDLRVFLTVDAAEQLRRIEARSGPEKLRMFRDRWIPLEESYFTAFDLPARCDMALKG